MRCRRVVLALAAALAAVVLLAGCGSGSHRVAPALQSGGQAIQPVTDPSLDETLVELAEMECPEGVDEELWAELKGALEEALICRVRSRAAPTGDNAKTVDGGAQDPTLQGKFTSTPPTGEMNRVNDLTILDNGDGTFTLSWHYRNLGDYDQNGKVGISDITPLAMHYGESYEPTDANCLLAVIDGSGNGRIGIEDITPIAMNFAAGVHHYAVEGAPNEAGAYELVSEIAQDAGTGDGRLEYSAIIESPAALWHRVVPYDSEGAPGEPSNAVLRPSNEPIIYEASPTEGYQHEEYTFSATVTGAEPLEYVWDFGGGANPDTSTEPSPTVTLSDAGEYEASLTVTNAYGEASFPFSLTVSERDTWAHTWGGEGHEAAEDLAVDEEGNIYVLGYTESFGAGSSDVLVLKYAPDGELQWARTWGGEYPENPVGIAVLNDGNIVVGGDTSNFGAGADDIFILKYDPEGNLLMQKTWGTADYERAEDMAVDEEDNIYFAGYWTTFGGKSDTLTVKFDSNGHIIWAKKCDRGARERAYCIAAGAGCAYMRPSIQVDGEDADATLVKYDKEGDVEWVTSWGGDGDDYITGLIVGQDGLVYMSGSTTSFGEGETDLLLLEVLPDGIINRALIWGTPNAEGGGALTCDEDGRLWLRGARQNAGNWYGLLLCVDKNWGILKALTVCRDWQLLSALSFDGKMNLYQAGGSTDSDIVWEDISGIADEPQGNTIVLEWSESLIEGTEGEADGLVSEPVGIVDVGGGGGDVLLLKNFPR